MHESLEEKLKREASLALNSESLEEGMRHLSRAFYLFSEESERIKKNYLKLKEELKKTHLHLDKTHEELIKSVTQLKTTSSYLNSLLKNISQGILFIHMNGTILSYNKAAEKILKIEESKVLFRKYTQVFKDTFFGFSVKDALDFGMLTSLSYFTHFLEAERREIEVTSSFLSDGENPYGGLLLLLRDITEFEKLKQVTHRTSRLQQLGEIAATIAHEIKNPLGGIRGYASLLCQDLKTRSEREKIQNIIEGVKILDKLVEKVLVYTKPLELQLHSHDFSMFLRNTCKFLIMDPNFNRKYQLEIHISDDPLFVPFDKDAMRSCLWNLIINAFQSMKKGGKVTVSLMKQDQSILLNISDQGIGIAEKDLENIFSPFFTTKEEGNGLGLAEAHKIVQAHRGKIEVRSQLEKGTTFTLSLPIRR